MTVISSVKRTTIVPFDEKNSNTNIIPRTQNREIIIERNKSLKYPIPIEPDYRFDKTEIRPFPTNQKTLPKKGASTFHFSDGRKSRGKKINARKPRLKNATYSAWEIAVTVPDVKRTFIQDSLRYSSPRSSRGFEFFRRRFALESTRKLGIHHAGGCSSDSLDRSTPVMLALLARTEEKGRKKRKRKKGDRSISVGGTTSN